MFCNLAPVALADYNSIGQLVTLPQGTILFREDDPGNQVLVICEGQVKLSSSSRDGRTLNLKIALPGDVLGLSAVITETNFEVTAETLTNVTAKSIRSAEFRAFLQRHGEASMHAATALADEYKSAFVDARRLALSGSIAGRLAGLLLDWGGAASCGKLEMQFKMVLTHEDLAGFTGTSRESVTRTLGKFQKDNLIEIRGATVHILSPDKLARLSA
jgi:CRP/FNR family cyclic AMP-dependent transcriptional regulator